MSPERNASHEVIRFQRRIKIENSAPAAWDSDWGFLKSPQAMEKERDIREFYGDKPLEPLGLPSEGSAPFFERARLWKRMEPKTKFVRPVLTSHEIGWRPPVDLLVYRGILSFSLLTIQLEESNITNHNEPSNRFRFLIILNAL